MAAAALHHLAGDFERATAIYESVLVDTPDGLDRADVLYALAELGTCPLPARAALVEEAIEHARSDDERATRLLGLLAIVRWLLGDAESALQHAREGLACAESVGDPELLAVAIARVGHTEGWVLDVTPGLLERGVAIERTLRRPLMFHTSPAFMQACLLYDQDELARRERCSSRSRPPRSHVATSTRGYGWFFSGHASTGTPASRNSDSGTRRKRSSSPSRRRSRSPAAWC